MSGTHSVKYSAYVVSHEEMNHTISLADGILFAGRERYWELLEKRQRERHGNGEEVRQSAEAGALQRRKREVAQ